MLDVFVCIDPIEDGGSVFNVVLNPCTDCHTIDSLIIMDEISTTDTIKLLQLRCIKCGYTKHGIYNVNYH